MDICGFGDEIKSCKFAAINLLIKPRTYMNRHTQNKTKNKEWWKDSAYFDQIKD